MTLPEIPNLPIPPLPFEVPFLIHPVVAHFAIAIPVIVLVLELINLLVKRRAITVTSMTLIVTMIIIYVGLFITGKADGSEGYMLLNETAQAEFKEHKLIGLYLIYSTVLILIFKLMAMFIQKTAFKAIFIVAMIAFVGLNMYQGKEGGELVYTYGMNVTAANDANDLVEELSDELEELKVELEALKEEQSKGFDMNVSKTIDAIKNSETLKTIKDVFTSEEGVIDIEAEEENTSDDPNASKVAA